jgi:hypothetical protein
MVLFVTEPPIWDRLASEVNRKEREQLLEQKKAEQEIKECSFHPGDSALFVLSLKKEYG